MKELSFDLAKQKDSSDIKSPIFNKASLALFPYMVRPSGVVQISANLDKNY